MTETSSPRTAARQPSPTRADRRAERRSRTTPVVAYPARPRERRYRQTIRRVDLWSVLKISFCFYLCALLVILCAGAVLWWIGSAFGVVDDVESFVGELLNADDFEFLSWNILRGATLIGLVFTCLAVLATVLAGAFYNLFSELIGGVEVTIVEEEPNGR